VLNPPEEIISFCRTVQVNNQSGLEVLLKSWTELFDVIQGYTQIRLSVVALSRVFECSVEDIAVKGDRIVPSGRIITRSHRQEGRSER
jgi:hypothetical protein